MLKEVLGTRLQRYHLGIMVQRYYVLGTIQKALGYKGTMY